MTAAPILAFEAEANAWAAKLARAQADADYALIALSDHCSEAGTLPQDDRVAAALNAAQARQAQRLKAIGGERE